MLDLLKGYKVISIIGMGKNVGKTTTLNYIITNLKNMQIGLTSIGYDGEAIDTITKKVKPRIWLAKNTVFVTTKDLVKELQLSYEIIEETSWTTPLGDIIIAKAKSDGYVVLSGPSNKSQIKQLLNKYEAFNLDKCLIDGAFGKVMSSDSYLADAVILATGLAYSNNLEKLVKETIYRAHLYNEEKIFVARTTKLRTLDLADVIGNEEKIIKKLEKIDIAYIKGAITDRLIFELLFNSKLANLTLVLDNPTMCFVSEDLASKLSLRNIKICFRKSSKVIAITINPYSPIGGMIDSDKLKNELQKLTDIPIFDVVKEEQSFGQNKD